MKILSTYKDFINESVRDKMTPRHEDDIRQSFIDKGYSFRHELISASFISDVDSVEPILDLMYDFYKTTDSDEIKEIIEDDYVAGLDVAVVDGYYDTVEAYLMYDIPGLGMSHLQTLLNYNYAGAAELVYDRLKDGMSDEERKEVEAKIENMRLNESVRDRMTPKSEDDIKRDLDKLSPDKKLNKGINAELPWLVEDALKSGANPNLTYPDSSYPKGFTCLMKVIMTNCNLEIIKLLVKYGADVEAKTKNGSSVLGMLRSQIGTYHNQLYQLAYDFIKSEIDKMNESLRDKMTPKSSDNIRKDMLEYFEKNKMHGINKNIAKTNIFDSSDVVFCVEYWEDYFYDIDNYLTNVTNSTKELHQLTDNLGVYVCYPEVKVIEYTEKGEESTCWYFSQEHIEPIIDYMISENARKEAL